MSTDKEQQFCQIADKLIADFKLQRDKRMLIIATDNIGDFYFLVSALDYVQIKYDVTFFIACRSGSKSHKILKAFQSGGGNIHIITLPINLCTLYFSLSESTILKYDKIIMDLEHSKAYPQLWHWMASRETKENLIHPKYNYNLSGNLHLTQEDGQKTVFIIPHSNFHGTPDLSFWRTVCKTFKLLKFNLIINGNQNIDYGSDITYIFPPLDQIVPFANQCSLVFGIRTGLMEAVAAETKTKMVIINSGKEIENDYPHITPGKISYWPIKRVRSSCFQYIDNLIDIHAKSLLPDFKYYTSNNIILFEKLYNAKVLTYLWAMTKKPFQFYDQSYHITKNFCFITYSLMQDRAFCLCKYAIQPALDYEIHACLKDAATGDIIAEQHFIRCNPLVFAVPRSGSFRIYMKIYHPDNYRYCCFESEKPSSQNLSNA